MQRANWHRCSRVAVAIGVMSATAILAAAGRDEPPITPVSGVSTLRSHGLTVERTSMGFTGHLGPWPDAPAQSAPAIPEPARRASLSGADLYRLNCRACHRADGEGVPPEVNTLIGPVQGTSLALWTERMRDLDRPIDPVFGQQVVAGARADLLKRLKDGGQKMPSFAYLRDDEVQALFAYLELLAGVPGARQRQRSVDVPAMRVGEYVVKGTCHICHDSVGAWPTPAALMNGDVPSLAAMPAHHTLVTLVEKVRRGAVVTMGLMPLPYRGRMPVLDYINADEAAAAYLYLAAYPPHY